MTPKQPDFIVTEFLGAFRLVAPFAQTGAAQNAHEDAVNEISLWMGLSFVATASTAVTCQWEELYSAAFARLQELKLIDVRGSADSMKCHHQCRSLVRALCSRKLESPSKVMMPPTP
eukprot:223720-Amphidinium_carterae.1